jgi:hypothetical protein
LLLTIPEETTFHCAEVSCRRKFTSDSWQLQHIKISHSEVLEVAHQENLTICSTPAHIEAAQRRQFNANNGSGKDLEVFPYLECIECIKDVESESLPPPSPRTEIYPSAGAPLIDYIAASWERNAQGCCETNQQINTWYPFVMHEDYDYIQYGIEKKGMKMYYDNMLKEEYTALRFRSFKNGDGVQKLMASMPDDKAHGEWELRTFEDMR